jgi:mannitol/fructose-specific phosphotransferase system IIA component (Ntr-type)
LPVAKGVPIARESKISRIISFETIRLELETPAKWHELLEYTNDEEPFSLPSPIEQKEAIITELVDVLKPSGVIQHKIRLINDLINRERKASTALGHGIAVPHVRTDHARDIAMGFARTSYPLDWDSPDGLPVDLFFIMVAPPYDDMIYNRLWPKLAGLLQHENIRDVLRSACDPGEVIKIIKQEE